MKSADKKVILSIYRVLFRHFGAQYWWPGQTRFEVIVGAILTQNTNWGNVEKALANLKKRKLLTPQKLSSISFSRLSELIRPSGYFKIKAKRLKNFLDFLFKEYRGDLNQIQGESADLLREKLLAVNGIGPETADSILLYAFGKPVFVIDAYAKRFLYRHGLAEEKTDYGSLQKLFTGALPEEVQLFNEYHALIVRLGKVYCRPKPDCEQCPLKGVRYSLKNKCCLCHRFLPDPKDRVYQGEGRLLYCLKCSGCPANS